MRLVILFSSSSVLSVANFFNPLSNLTEWAGRNSPRDLNIFLVPAKRIPAGVRKIMNANAISIEQTAARPQYHVCFKCHFETESSGGACPRCGKPLYSEKNIRTRGWVLIGCGLFLAGFMSAITLFVTGLIYNSTNDAAMRAKLESEMHLFVLMYLVFGGVIAAGLTALAMGVWQIVFGRRNRLLVWLFMALVTAAITVGVSFQYFVK